MGGGRGGGGRGGGGVLSKDNQVLEVGLNEELVSLFSRALEIAEADKISSQQ